MRFPQATRCTWTGTGGQRVAGWSRRAIRAIAVGLSLTRIAILAHWASDVVAGFALGAILERVLRLWTGYSNGISKEDDHADS
ncbi:MULTISPECIES: phosphatase PAP2 family protein [unclassified Bradyrhizobium]